VKYFVINSCCSCDSGELLLSSEVYKTLIFQLLALYYCYSTYYKLFHQCYTVIHLSFLSTLYSLIYLCRQITISRVLSRRDVIIKQLQSKRDEIKEVVVHSKTCSEFLEQLQDNITAMESKGVGEQVTSMSALKELLSTIEGLLNDELFIKQIEIPKFEAQDTLAFCELVYKSEEAISIN